MEHIQVILLDLPVTVPGLTVMNGDDSYTIFINARLSDHMQHKAYDCQVSYINDHNYDKMYDVSILGNIQSVV